MAVAQRVPRRSRRTTRAKTHRYTIDASVFVNAFNPHEDGHAQSLQVLTTIQERGDPAIVPTLIVAEVARPSLGQATTARVRFIMQTRQLHSRT
jgi:predicted nucleic acid-binding protein